MKKTLALLLALGMLVLMLAAVLVLPLILSPVSARIAQSRAESAGGSNR